MVSAVNNTNNDNVAEEHMMMLQTLQAQMQELLQKGVTDQLRLEEERRKQEEERQQQAEKMAQLKEQNKRLLERLEQSKREGHSREPTSPPHQSGTKALTQTVPHTSLVHQTHQSVKHVIPNRVANPRSHPLRMTS